MSDDEERMRLRVSLRMFGERRDFTADVPHRPIRPRHLLPLFRDISDASAEVGRSRAERDGKHVSCTAGCTSCCDQLVPLGQPEAHALRDLVEDLPPPRRRVIERRFREARARIEEAGLLSQLDDVDGISRLSEEEYAKLAALYFSLRIRCPFLEGSSCSIYAERPLACREYLVTTSPTLCERLEPGIRRVDLPLDLSVELTDFEPGPRRIPMVSAIAWANANPDLGPLQAPNELLGAVVEHVAPKR